eukprot:1161867-Pelagomonas_calceolata.AAC.4
MARLVEVSCRVQGIGSIDIFTHTQEDNVESDLGTLKLFAQFTVFCCEAASWAPGLVKSHAEIAGNEYTDSIAEYQASLKDNNLTDTGIPNTGPGCNPFYNIAWLARGEARPTTPESSIPIPNLDTPQALRIL